MGNEVIDRAFDALKNDMGKKNVIVQSEFAKFRPLFDMSIQEPNEYPAEALTALIVEYKNRFISNLPIILVSEDGSEVLEELSPMFVSIPSINKVIKRSEELMQAHSNIMSSDTQPAEKKAEISAALKQAVELTIVHDPSYTAAKEKSMAISNKFDKKQNISEGKVADSSTDDMEWK